MRLKFHERAMIIIGGKREKRGGRGNEGDVSAVQA